MKEVTLVVYDLISFVSAMLSPGYEEEEYVTFRRATQRLINFTPKRAAAIPSAELKDLLTPTWLGKVNAKLAVTMAERQHFQRLVELISRGKEVEKDDPLAPWALFYCHKVIYLANLAPGLTPFVEYEITPLSLTLLRLNRKTPVGWDMMFTLFLTLELSSYGVDFSEPFSLFGKVWCGRIWDLVREERHKRAG